MGRHEPLTSLALGRSPYDDVVEGEGEADLHEPTRKYDEHGRVVNEESKRKNKDIIRAHNEVMLVIGVAEPESSHTGVDSARLHRDYENATGRQFLRLGRMLVVAGVWGVHGVRQRIMVYKETARLPFLDMMLREGRTHALSQLLFAGMPSFFSAWSLQWCSKSAVARNHVWLRAILSHIRFHLQIYVAMQRLDLIPGFRWFPSIDFLIPFSRSSPFIAPLPLCSPGAESFLAWSGNIAVSLAPYAGYYLIGCAWDILNRYIRRRLLTTLPQPFLSTSASQRALAPVNSSQTQSFPDSPTLGDADREIRHTQSPEITSPGPSTINSEGVGDNFPVGTIRREGTFSSRGGDDYATDEEDPETVNATLISFDVDTSEATEPPTGIWSAELRPSNSDDSGAHQKEAPRYIVNTLTSLPSLLAGDILTSSLTHILLTPLNILVFRAMARAFSRKFGLSVDHILEVSFANDQATRMILNLAQTEVLKFLVSFGAWTLITGVAQRFHVTDEEWKEYQLGEERDIAAESVGEQADAADTARSS
ncbi:hypothetical protein GGS21DRAFT_534214 [Xylaria nigripes]|nr:hypothetical protein GGS21DRAFT_534214 [Xylaria nigripes]